MSTTLVLEDGLLERRLRRSSDLIRLLLSLAGAALTIAVAYVATRTTQGLDTDLLRASALLPSIVVLALNLIAGAGTLILPVAAAVDLVTRRRGDQLLHALIALLAGVLAALGVLVALDLVDNDRLRLALSGATDPELGQADNPLLTALVAYVVVARLIGRPVWGRLAGGVIGTAALTGFLSGGITLAGVVLSVVLGLAVGFAVRFGWGITPTRPRGLAIAEAVADLGIAITTLRAQRQTERGRRYSGMTASGQQIELVVLDRDLEGSDLLSATWRRLRLREPGHSGFRSIRRSLDRSALMSHAYAAAGVPTPRLMGVSVVGAESAVLCFEHVPGWRYQSAQTPAALTDDDLRSAWRALAHMRQARIAHRDLDADALLRGDDGTTYILDTGRGVVAASDLQLRIDVAHLLATLALVTSPERAVATAREVLGDAILTRALPAVQLFAFPPATQRAMRRTRHLLSTLRSQVAALIPEGTVVEDVRLERIGWRTVITAILGTIAVYLVATQLADVNLSALMRDADLGWALIALVLATLSYVAATATYVAFVPEHLSAIRTLLAQLAASFLSLVSPPTVGVVATNVRFLMRSGLTPALAAASIGLTQVVGAVVHIVLLLGFGLAAGTSADLTFDPPREVIVALAATGVLLILALPLPWVRRWLASRLRPVARQVVPRLVQVAQQPTRLLVGVGSQVLLNVALAISLIASVRAFGGDITIAAGFFVYLAGATLGQVVPTPGGLGGVEAALVAGLTAVGVDARAAISAVLLYRLVTFWLPKLPGWFAFRYLTARNAL